MTRIIFPVISGIHGLIHLMGFVKAFNLAEVDWMVWDWDDDLIDEFYLFLNPVALGKGMVIFKELNSMRKFVLETPRAFSCGIVLINYRRAT